MARHRRKPFVFPSTVYVGHGGLYSASLIASEDIREVVNEGKNGQTVGVYVLKEVVQATLEVVVRTEKQK